MQHPYKHLQIIIISHRLKCGRLFGHSSRSSYYIFISPSRLSRGDQAVTAHTTSVPAPPTANMMMITSFILASLLEPPTPSSQQRHSAHHHHNKNAVVRACRIWNARSDSSMAHRLAWRRNHTGLRCASSCQADDQAIINITSTCSRRRRPIFFLARAQRHQNPAAAAPAVLPPHACQCEN